PAVIEAIVTASYSTVSKTVVLTVGPGSSTASAVFEGMDTTTRGNWPAKYNYKQVTIIGDKTSNPSYASVTPSGAGFLVWAESTTDSRALLKLSSPASRVAARWAAIYSFFVDIN